MRMLLARRDGTLLRESPGGHELRAHRWREYVVLVHWVGDLMTESKMLTQQEAVAIGKFAEDANA